MTATSQHESHPGAESLNAFAEQALGARERGHVLEHLAACARCRQIVSLAREAAEANAVRAARPIAIQPNAWWKRWRLVWVPAAVAGAFAVASISVFIHQSQRREVAISIAQQTAVPGMELATTSAPPEQAQAAQRPSPIAGKALAEAMRPERTGTRLGKRERESEITEADHLWPLSTRSGDRPEPAPEPLPISSAENRALEDEGHAGAIGPSRFAQVPSVAQIGEGDRKKIDAAVAQNQLVAAQATATASEHGPENGAAGSREQVVVAGQQLVTRPAPAASAGAFMKMRAGAVSTGRMASSINLPSGLLVLSIASANHRSLAIDTAGALFASEDGGMTWRRVTTQWSGRAVMVLASKSPIANAEAAPTAQTSTAAGAAGNPVGASETPSPITFFEIVNDRNQIWRSADGLTWIAK